MVRYEWSGIPASRNPPRDVDISGWENLDLGQDIYSEPILRVWWQPRLSKIETDSRRTYDETATFARSEIASLPVSDLEFMYAYIEARAYVAVKHLFNPPATEYLLYRGDQDLWVHTTDARMAGRLLIAAASELRQEHGKTEDRIKRDREYAEKGVKLAKFDPRRVFVKRHERRSR